MDDRQPSRSVRRPIDDYPKRPQDIQSEKPSRQTSISINKSNSTFPDPDETINIAENMAEILNTSRENGFIADDKKRDSINPSIKSAGTKPVFVSKVSSIENIIKTNRAYIKIVILVAIIETLHFSIVNKEAMQNKKKSILIRKRSTGMTYIGTVLIMTKYMYGEKSTSLES